MISSLVFYTHPLDAHVLGQVWPWEQHHGWQSAHLVQNSILAPNVWKSKQKPKNCRPKEIPRHFCIFPFCACKQMLHYLYHGMHEVQAQRACSELQLIGESGWRAGKARRESGSCFLRDWVRRGPGTGQSGSAGLCPEAFRGNCSTSGTAMGGGGQPVQWHSLHWVRCAMKEKKSGTVQLTTVRTV